MVATVEWPGEGKDDVTAITIAAVKRKLALFDAYPAWDRDALVDHCLDFARAAEGKLDGKKGKLSTFISCVVHRRMFDLHKKLRREQRREVIATETRSYLQQGRAFEDVDDSLPLAEWAGEIYRQAVHTVGRTLTGRGTRYIEPAQAAALLAIKRRMKLSVRGVTSLLADRPEIVRSIRLKRLPSHMRIHRLCNSYGGVAANNKGQGRTRMAKNGSDWINEAEAARLVGLSSSTLKSLRLGKQSPFLIFMPRGRVRYQRKQVLEWIESQTTRPAVGQGVGAEAQ